MASCVVKGCKKRRVSGIRYCRDHEARNSLLTESELSEYLLLEERIRADKLATRVEAYEIRDIRQEADARISQKVSMKRALIARTKDNEKKYQDLILKISEERGITKLGIDPDTGEISELE